MRSAYSTVTTTFNLVFSAVQDEPVCGAAVAAGPGAPHGLHGSGQGHGWRWYSGRW